MIDQTFYKVFDFYHYFTQRNVNGQFKNNLCKKAKHTREHPTQGRGATFITTEMAVALKRHIIRVRRVIRLMIRPQIGNMELF